MNNTRSALFRRVPEAGDHYGDGRQRWQGEDTLHWSNLKNNPESAFNRSQFHDAPGKSERAFYQGKLLRFDDFGNMNFGAAGEAMGYPLDFLQKGAGVAQAIDHARGGTTEPGSQGHFGDEARDPLNIDRGHAAAQRFTHFSYPPLFSKW